MCTYIFRLDSAHSTSYKQLGEILNGKSTKVVKCFPEHFPVMQLFQEFTIQLYQKVYRAFFTSYLFVQGCLLIMSSITIEVLFMKVCSVESSYGFNFYFIFLHCYS